MFGSGYAAVPFIPCFFFSLPGVATAIASVIMSERMEATAMEATPVDENDDRKQK